MQKEESKNILDQIDESTIMGSTQAETSQLKQEDFSSDLEKITKVSDLSKFILQYSGLNIKKSEDIVENLNTISKRMHDKNVDRDQLEMFLNRVDKLINGSKQIDSRVKNQLNSVLPDILNNIENLPEKTDEQKTPKILTDDEKIQQFKNTLDLSNIPEDRKNRLMQKFEQKLKDQNIKVMKFSKSKPVVSAVDKDSQKLKFKHTAKSSFKLRNIDC